MSLEEDIARLRVAESGNRDFKEDGTPVESPKGALFALQVMPSTAQDPGYGIKPAQSQTPEEYNRVGQEYFQKMMEVYRDDKELALAAYNAGPSNVDRALELGGREGFWQHLPKPEETVPFVERNLKSKISGIYIPPKATDVWTAVDEAMANPPSAPSGQSWSLIDDALASAEPSDSPWNQVDALTAQQAGSSTFLPETEQDTSLGKLLTDLGTDVLMMGAAGAGASALAAGGVIATGGLAVPVAAGLIYGGMKLTKSTLEGKPERSLTEDITGQKFDPAISQIFSAGEDILMFGGGGEAWRLTKKGLKLVGGGTGKVMKGVDLLFHQPAEAIGKRITPIGEFFWDNILVKPFEVEIPGIKKSVSEIFVPGSERLVKKGFASVARTFNRSAVMKDLTTDAGKALSRELVTLLPSEQYEVLKGLRGTPLSQLTSDKAKQIVASFDSRLKDAGLHKLYESEFRSALSKGLTKPVEDLEAQVSSNDIRSMLQLFEQGVGTKLKGGIPSPGAVGAVQAIPRVKDIHKALDTIIDHPYVSDVWKNFAKDMYDVSARTPVEVASASRQASTKYLVNKITANPGVVSAVAKPGYVQSNWGKFKGMYIPKDVELELQAITKVPEIVHGFVQKWFTSPFKASVTVLRPSYHLMNTFGNLVLNDWGGLPFYRVDLYSKALKDMRANSQNWKEFARLTGVGGSWAQQELTQLHAGMKYGASMMDKIYNVYQKVVQPVSSFTTAETNMFKFAKYLHSRENGLTATEAALDSQKWIFDFSQMTPEVANLSKYVMPFARWQTRIVPLMAETAVKHPLRLSKWFAFGQGIQSLALEQVGMTDEEWTQTKQMLPNHMQSGAFLMMPWRDGKGRLNLMNASLILPGLQQITDTYSRSWTEQIVSNPLLTMYSALQSRTKYTGAPLYYEWEEPSTQYSKVLSYMWEQLSPAVVPGGADWNKLWAAYQDHPEAMSTEMALANALGFRTTPVDVAAAARRKETVQRIHEAEVQGQMQKELRKSSSADETQDILLKYQRIRERMYRK